MHTSLKIQRYHPLKVHNPHDRKKKREKLMFVDYKKIENIVEKAMSSLIASSLNDYIKQLRDIMDKEQKIIQKTADSTIKKIEEPMNKLNTLEKNMSEIQKKLIDLEAENKKLINENRQKNIIIERKTKQIKRLKYGH